MILKNLYIEEFGNLKNLSVDLSRGINVFEGKNEAGKSTLLAFIRYMFYGFPRRGAAQGGDEWIKRLSWRGKRAAGRLTLAFGGETFRVTRATTMRGSEAHPTLSEESEVFSLTVGEVISLGGKSAGEYFLGLPEQLYDSSLCLAQSEAERVSAAGVHEAVGAMLFSGESTLHAEAAEKKLDEARRELMHLRGNGGGIPTLERESARLDAEAETARREAAALADARAAAFRLSQKAEEKKALLRDVTLLAESRKIDSVLALFDDCHRAEREEREAERVLEFEKATVDKFPAEEELQRAAALVQKIETAKRQTAIFTPERAQLKGVSYDEKLIAGAALIREKGGAKALLAALGKERKKGKAFLFLSLILSLAALAACAVGFVLSIPAFFAAGGACVLAAVVSFAFFAGVTRAEKKKFGALGVENAAMLRTHLEQCVREETSKNETDARLAFVENELDAARLEEEEAFSALNAFLEGAGESAAKDADDAERRLREILLHRRDAMAARDAANLSFEKAKSKREALVGQIGHEDEAALRQRLAELPRCNESAEMLKEKESILREALSAIERELETARSTEAALGATAHDLGAILAESERVGKELAAARAKLDAVTMAREALGEASAELRKGVTPRLREDAARIFTALTNGKYEELVLGDDFSISLSVDGKCLPIAHFSAGCRDAAYLSLRLALLATLSEEKLPLLFDEAFSRLDDERARSLLGVISRYAEGGGQVLLFTCHTRERRMLGENGAEFIALGDPLAAL